MVKRTIKFTDFNGVEKQLDCYFNMSKSELARLYFAQDDFATKIRTIMQTKDTKKLFAMFEDIIRLSYGKKSDDGMRFIKHENGHALADEFVETPAFDELYFQMIRDPEEFAKFIHAILPPDLAAEVEKAQKNGDIPEELKGLM